MARKSKETPLTQRYRNLDDPTAAFPIGALSGIVEQLADEDSALSDDASTGTLVVDGDGSVRPAFLILSMIFGGIVAIGIVAGVAVFVFLL